MSRRRSQNPTKAISITLKQSTIDKIDAILSYKSSRSRYIQACIDAFMERDTGINARTASTQYLIHRIIERDDVTDYWKERLKTLSETL